jgi:hypothetical protein
MGQAGKQLTVRRCMASDFQQGSCFPQERYVILSLLKCVFSAKVKIKKKPIITH